MSNIETQSCSVEQCDRIHYRKTFCVSHYWLDYKRRKEAGEVRPVSGRKEVARKHAAKLAETIDRGRAPAVPGTRPLRSLDPLTNNYMSIHYQLRRDRGRASGETCPCGDQASQWAFDHAEPVPQYCPNTGKVFSTNIYNYIALCVSCHALFDRWHETTEALVLRQRWTANR